MVARSPVILMKCSRWSAACFFVAFDHLVLRLLVCIVVYIQTIMAAVLTNVAIWEKLNNVLTILRCTYIKGLFVPCIAIV